MKFTAEFEAGSRADLAGRLKEIATLVDQHVVEEGEGWNVEGEMFDEKDHKGPTTYTIKATVKQLVPDEELDLDDQNDGPADGVEEEYKVKAYTAQAAIEYARDLFHSTIPIACLEDYEIDFDIPEPESEQGRPENHA